MCVGCVCMCVCTNNFVGLMNDDGVVYAIRLAPLFHDTDVVCACACKEKGTGMGS